MSLRSDPDGVDEPLVAFLVAGEVVRLPQYLFVRSMTFRHVLPAVEVVQLGLEASLVLVHRLNHIDSGFVAILAVLLLEACRDDRHTSVVVPTTNAVIDLLHHRRLCNPPLSGGLRRVLRRVGENPRCTGDGRNLVVPEQVPELPSVPASLRGDLLETVKGFECDSVSLHIELELTVPVVPFAARLDGDGFAQRIFGTGQIKGEHLRAGLLLDLLSGLDELFPGLYLLTDFHRVGRQSRLFEQFLVVREMVTALRLRHSEPLQLVVGVHAVERLRHRSEIVFQLLQFGHGCVSAL